MLPPEKVSLSDFVTRRLNPVKIGMAYLRHELAHHTTGERTSVDRHEMANLIATLELFVEDYEKLVLRDPRTAAAPMGAVERSYVADARS